MDQTPAATKLDSKERGGSLFLIAWGLFMAGSVVAQALWTLLYKAGYKNESLPQEFVWAFYLSLSCTAVFMALVGLFRWKDAADEQNRVWRGIAGVILFVASIPAAVIVAMFIAMVVPPLFGIDAKTGQPR